MSPPIPSTPTNPAAGAAAAAAAAHPRARPKMPFDLAIFLDRLLRTSMLLAGMAAAVAAAVAILAEQSLLLDAIIILLCGIFFLSLATASLAVAGALLFVLFHFLVLLCRLAWILLRFGFPGFVLDLVDLVDWLVVDDLLAAGEEWRLRLAFFVVVR